MGETEEKKVEREREESMEGEALAIEAPQFHTTRKLWWFVRVCLECTEPVLSSRMKSHVHVVIRQLRQLLGGAFNSSRVSYSSRARETRKVKYSKRSDDNKIRLQLHWRRSIHTFPLN